MGDAPPLLEDLEELPSDATAAAARAPREVLGVPDEPQLPAERPIGKYERLFRERCVRDHALAAKPGGHPKGFTFDAEDAERVITFLESYCKHHKGEWAGRPLLLEPWQQEIFRELFGWKLRDGSRRFRTAYVEIPRKNGKTEVAAGVGVYLEVGDREPGAEVYCAATMRDQARIVFEAASAMVKQSPDLKRFLQTLKNAIYCEALGSKFQPVSADHDTLDGLNPHGAILDELHAHKSRGVWDVMVSAMGARRQPLTLAITTAGVYRPEWIGWQQHDYACKVLEGIFEDDSYFAFIAAADPDDDWTQPATWWKANPNLGVSVKLEYLAAEARRAENQPSSLNNFLRYHLDRWTQQVDRWIPIEKWNACPSEPIDLSRLAGRRCFAGFDLASTTDITALALLFPDDDALDLVFRFYVPEEKILERAQRDRVPYDLWVRQGFLTATPGNVTDYEFIREDLRGFAKRHSVQEVGFDPWNASHLSTQLLGDGFQMVEVRQGYRSLSEATKQFEARVLARRIRHGGNPVMRWMMSNVAIRQDPNGNIAPDKSKSTEKIDGVVAAIIGLSRLIVQPEQQGSIYETRGVRSV